MQILSIAEAKQITKHNKIVFLTGVTGQDGSFMIDYLLKNTNYMIFGGARRLSVSNHENISHLEGNPRFHLINFDLTDAHSISTIIETLKPDYFVNLAAQSFVKSSWDFPSQTWETNATSMIHILEAIRLHCPHCRVYNAGCHSEDTRVLTPAGLKNYKELNVGDIVYSINQKTKDLEFKKITKIFEYDYNGELYEFKKGGLLVTPNHKMLYKTSKNNIAIKNASEFIKLADVKYPINNPYKGKILDVMTDLSGHIPIQKKKGNSVYGKHITKINTYDLMYLIGLYIGDGSCRIIKKKKMVTSHIGNRSRNQYGHYMPTPPDAVEFEAEYQCPQSIIDIPPSDECFPKVIRVLEKNNITWNLHGSCDITVHQWGLHKYFSECGHSSSTKHIPNWIFELDSSYQMKVLEGIRDSDGDDRNIISTVSSQLQVDLLKLHINCGIMPTFSERPPRISVLKDGRVITGNFSEKMVYGLKENTGYQRGNYKKVNYSGKVWCFEIEDNHNFIVERCGKLTFSGNSSEEFGNVEYAPQDENHPMKPRSPYGASKAAARQLIKVYRESYNLYAIQGWLFNHESPRRGEEFVTRKITMGVARILKESQNIILPPPQPPVVPIELGNIDAKRDWSHAEDCVDAIWKMLNQELYRDDLPKLCNDIDSNEKTISNKFTPEAFKMLTETITEYVVASGEYHTIREFVEEAFKCININGIWIGSGIDEQYVVSSIGQILPMGTVLVKINPVFYRPAEVELLCGNPAKIKSDLKWNPKTSFTELVKNMVSSDINNII